MASTTPDLQLPSQLKLVFIVSTEGWPGWVDLGGWLHAEIIYQSKDITHPGTNQAQLRVTTLIKGNALPLS